MNQKIATYMIISHFLVAVSLFFPEYMYFGVKACYN